MKEGLPGQEYVAQALLGDCPKSLSARGLRPPSPPLSGSASRRGLQLLQFLQPLPNRLGGARQDVGDILDAPWPSFAASIAASRRRSSSDNHPRTRLLFPFHVRPVGFQAELLSCPPRVEMLIHSLSQSDKLFRAES
jgi:hypothetical protein